MRLESVRRPADDDCTPLALPLYNPLDTAAPPRSPAFPPREPVREDSAESQMTLKGIGYFSADPTDGVAEGQRTPVPTLETSFLESLDIDAHFRNTTAEPIDGGVAETELIAPSDQSVTVEHSSLRPDAALPEPSTNTKKHQNLRHVVPASNLHSTRTKVHSAPLGLLPRSTSYAPHTNPSSYSSSMGDLAHHTSTPASRLKNKRSAPNLVPTLSPEGESTCLTSLPGLPGLPGLHGLPLPGLPGSMSNTTSAPHLRRPKFESVRRLFDKVATT